MNNRKLLALCLGIVFLSSCDEFKAWYAREFKQGEVTSGIARLSAQHVSMITGELSKRFKEKGVKVDIEKATDADEFGKGTVTKTIEDIDISYPREEVINKDCLGVTATWQGTVRVIKATQTIYGRLTGNEENPVIPDPNMVKMSIRVAPRNLRIKFSNKEASIELQSGELKFDAYPRLAQAQKGNLKGLRVIPTSNARFEHVQMINIKGMLFSEKVTMPFDISNSDYLVQIGEGEQGEENKIKGSMTAFGNWRTVPHDNNDLMPDYDKNVFKQSYDCKEELAGVVSYNKVLLEEKMGPGMAALTTLTMGKIAGQLADNYECGMSSPAFLKTTTLNGSTGTPGSASARLPAECVITFNQHRTEPDCFGIAYEINGEAKIIDASRNLKGELLLTPVKFVDAVQKYENKLAANDVAGALDIKPEAVLPLTRQPAEIALTADISKITLKEICLNSGSVSHAAHCSKNTNYQPVEFSLAGGQVSAKLKPFMARGTDPNDRSYGMCAVRNIPITEAELSVNGVRAVIKKSGNQLAMRAQGVYRALSGYIDNRENELSGDIAIGKVSVPFRAEGVSYLPLKPDYNRALFVDSFQSCNIGKFTLPQKDDDCL